MREKHLYGEKRRKSKTATGVAARQNETWRARLLHMARP
jgi:hypothetical protein